MISGFKNIPQVSEFLIKKINAAVCKDFVAPNGVMFYVPVKVKERLG